MLKIEFPRDLTVVLFEECLLYIWYIKTRRAYGPTWQMKQTFEMSSIVFPRNSIISNKSTKKVTQESIYSFDSR